VTDITSIISVTVAEALYSVTVAVYGAGLTSSRKGTPIMAVKQGKNWIAKNADGKFIGSHKSKAAAEKQEAEANKVSIKKRKPAKKK